MEAKAVQINLQGTFKWSTAILIDHSQVHRR